MYKLILKFKDKVIKEFPLMDNEVTIGRDAENEIAIDNSAISRHHAKIELVGGKYFVSDLGSTNGTFLNEKRIKQELKLKSGDEIIVGKHTIVFVSEAEEKEKTVGMVDLGGTVILDTAQQKELLGKQLQSAKATHKEKSARLLIIQSDEQREYKLTKETTVIGKSSVSDVVLKGFFVPQIAARIKKEGKTYYISGYGGWINVTVNDRIVGDNWKLYPNDIIQIRRIKIIFKQD